MSCSPDELTRCDVTTGGSDAPHTASVRVRGRPALSGAFDSNPATNAGRYVAWHRVWTGKANVARAHVLDTQTGKIVASCPHEHRSRRFGWTADGRKRISCAAYAQRCADKLLKRFLRELSATESVSRPPRSFRALLRTVGGHE